MIKVLFEGDEKKINSFQGSMKQLTKELAVLQSAFIGASYALDKFISATARDVVNLDNFNKQTGLSIDKLNEWKKAATLSNLNLGEEQVLENIKSLQQNISQIKLGGGDISGFSILGINPNSDAFNVLEQLRIKLKNIDNATAVNLIQRLGLSPEFLNVLRLSNEEFKKLSQGTFLSAKNRNDILKVAQAIKMLKTGFKELKDLSIAKLAPDLELLIKRFFNWMTKNSQNIVDAIKSILNIFTKFITIVAGSVSLIVSFVENILKAENGIKLLAGAFLLLLTATTPLNRIFNPLYLTLTGIMLLLEDVYTYKQGGDSLFGDLYKQLEKLSRFKIENLLGGAGAIAFIIKFRKEIVLLGQVLKTSLLETFNLIVKHPIISAITAISLAIYKLNDLYESGKLDNLLEKFGFGEYKKDTNNLIPNQPSLDNSVKNTNQNINVTQNINSSAVNATDVGSEVMRMLKTTNRFFEVGGY